MHRDLEPCRPFILSAGAVGTMRAMMQVIRTATAVVLRHYALHGCVWEYLREACCAAAVVDVVGGQGKHLRKRLIQLSGTLLVSQCQHMVLAFSHNAIRLAGANSKPAMIDVLP